MKFFVDVWFIGCAVIICFRLFSVQCSPIRLFETMNVPKLARPWIHLRSATPTLPHWASKVHIFPKSNVKHLCFSIFDCFQEQQEYAKKIFFGGSKVHGHPVLVAANVDQMKVKHHYDLPQIAICK